MNMQQFTTKQLEVMALESSPRGLQARKELEKRKTKEASEKPVEKATDSSKQAPKRKPKASTRKPRKTTQKQSTEAQKEIDKDSEGGVESTEQTKED